MQKIISFDKKWSYFRGCLGNVVFNQYDIISNVQKLEGIQLVYYVLWTCIEEVKVEFFLFINFYFNFFFVVFYYIFFKNIGFFFVQFKIGIENGFLLLVLVRKLKIEFYVFFVEILFKKLKLLLIKGSDRLVDGFDFNVIISDGEWYLLFIQCIDILVKFIVDYFEEIILFDESRWKNFEFFGQFFLGGVIFYVMFYKVVVNIDFILIFDYYFGCMKNLIINLKLYGFQ